MTTEQRLVFNLRRAKLGMAACTVDHIMVRWMNRVQAARVALRHFQAHTSANS